MKHSGKALTAALAALALSACTGTGSVSMVRDMEPQGSEFTRALHAGYVELMEKEIGYRDWPDASFFADKAAAAGRGEAVLPEDPATWDIWDRNHVEELTAERPLLMAALDGGGRDGRPQPAARAQTAYDCWVEEAQEGPENNLPVAAHQAEELAKCIDRFTAAMTELTAVEEVEMVERPVVTEFAVYFGWDVADLSPLLRIFLENVADEALRQQPSSIAVAGHADASGPDGYNLALSERRAANVAAFLVERGVSGETMEVRGLGETTPAVETANGIREPDNRRVEIVFE